MDFVKDIVNEIKKKMKDEKKRFSKKRDSPLKNSFSITSYFKQRPVADLEILKKGVANLAACGILCYTSIFILAKMGM